MKIGLKVSCLVAAFLGYAFLFFKCLECISMKSDALVLIGIIGLLVLLALGITAAIKMGKIVANFMINNNK